MMIVRQARLEDLAAILEIIPDLSYPLSYEEGKRVFDAIEANPNHYTFVAEEDGQILGTFGLIVMQHFSHAGAVSAVLNDVVVSQKAQGKGVGKAMMQHATDFAKSKACYKISLSSGKARDLAHEFYQKLGFEQHGLSFFLPLDS